MNFVTKTSITTLAQTFIMGSIDAYTFQNFDGSFVSAQTGNLVVFAYEYATKGWQTAYIRVPVLLGFLLGAFISQAFKHIQLANDRRFNIFCYLVLSCWDFWRARQLFTFRCSTCCSVLVSSPVMSWQFLTRLAPPALTTASWPEISKILPTTVMKPFLAMIGVPCWKLAAFWVGLSCLFSGLFLVLTCFMLPG